MPTGSRRENPGSMFRLAGDLGDARIVQKLLGGGVTEIFPILQHPDDFLVRSHFDQLRSTAIFAP